MEIKDKVYKIELTHAEVDLIYTVLDQTYDATANKDHWLTDYNQKVAPRLLNEQFKLMSRTI